MSNLLKHSIHKYITLCDVQYEKLDITYEIFGKELHTAPVIVVFHALTGNSDVAGENKGWWNGLIGENKAIDLSQFTVISFNILGNGYDGNLIDKYKDFTAKDIAILSFHTLRAIGVHQIYGVLGGSLGGGIAWELVAEFPQFSKYLFAIATDWKATDWILGFCGAQENILTNSAEPLVDARRMAMLFYRSPIALGEKFRRKKQSEIQYAVNSWLDHHGYKLKNRFQVQAYYMMNHLLSTVDITRGEYKKDVFQEIRSKVVQISISSDMLYPSSENEKTSKYLTKLGIENGHFVINSNDGHDAFLIEDDKIGAILSPYLNEAKKLQIA